MDFIFIIIMGGLWGSFANVCIYRLPQHKGVVAGRSYCPKCKKQISWYDNIPILSYLLIQGKCRKCKKKISIQYPLVELLSVYLSSILRRAQAQAVGKMQSSLRYLAFKLQRRHSHQTSQGVRLASIAPMNCPRRECVTFPLSE